MAIVHQNGCDARHGRGYPCFTQMKESPRSHVSAWWCVAAELAPEATLAIGLLGFALVGADVFLVIALLSAWVAGAGWLLANRLEGALWVFGGHTVALAIAFFLAASIPHDADGNVSSWYGPQALLAVAVVIAMPMLSAAVLWWTLQRSRPRRRLAVTDPVPPSRA